MFIVANLWSRWAGIFKEVGHLVFVKAGHQQDVALK